MRTISAFTLIELLVVIGIIGLLSMLLFSLIGTVGESQDRQNTAIAIMAASSAIDIFVSDTGAVPLPTGSRTDVHSGTWYPALNDGVWDKQQLGWRLGHVMSKDEKAGAEASAWAADVLADPYQSEVYMKQIHYPNGGYGGAVSAAKKIIMATISNADVEKYRGNLSQNGWDWNGKGDVGAWWQLTSRGWTKSYVFNIRGALARDAEERKWLTFDTFNKKDLPDDSFLDGDTILDAWGNPLIYIAHSTPAISYRYQRSRSKKSGCFPVGKNVGGRIEVSDRNNDGVVDTDDWAVSPPAATGDFEDQLDHQIDNNGDSTIDENDWANVLYYARPGNRIGYFLASAGPDGLFHCVWSQNVNEDNIMNRLTKEW